MSYDSVRIISIYASLLLFLFSAASAYSQCSPDTIAPSITCPGNISVACPHIIGNIFSFQTSIAPTSSDNCGIISQTYTLTGATNRTSPSTGINDASSETFLAGTTTVNYVVKDGANNTASCSFTVTVNDYTSPSVVCPSNKTLGNTLGFCHANVTQSQLGFPTAFDNCNGISTVVSGITLIAQSNPSLSYYEFPIGTTTVSWTVTDRAGNSSTCTQMVTIVDTEIPVLNCSSDITVNADSGLCTANVNVPIVTATDNCAVNTITNNYNNGGANASGIYPIGTTAVTFTATDSSNNISTVCTINITVVNTQSPTLALLGSNPISIEACATFTDPGATSNDSCFGDISSAIVVDASNVDLYAVGSYTIIYNVSNPSGIAATPITRTINVVDTTAPIITLQGTSPLTIGDCSTYTELGAVANDLCFGNSSVVIDNSAVTSGVIGTYTVYYNAIDASGNVASQVTRTVNVIDSSSPEIVLIGDNPQIIEACDEYVELGATVIDPCSNTNLTGSLIVDTSELDLSTVGTYFVTYQAMDSNGNVAIDVIREIIVVDTTLPEIVCPADIIVSNDLGSCNAVVNFADPIGSDSCSSFFIAQTEGLTSGSIFPLGTSVITYMVTDDSGNTATCSFNVIVNDTEAPVTVCQNVLMQLDPVTGIATLSTSDIDNGSSDNCGFTLSISQTDFDCSNLGDTIVTLTATDDAGNITTCDAMVTITDSSQNASVIISASLTTICENQAVTFSALTSDAGTSPTFQWFINGVAISGETAAEFTTTILNDGDEISVSMYPNASACAPEIISNTIVISVNDYNPPADAGPDISNTICTNTTITLSSNAIIGSGSTGLWTVTSGQTSGFSFSDATSDISTFTGDVGEVYTLAWTVDNPSPCSDTSDSMTVTFVGCSALDFDGVDDNITFRNNYNMDGAFTLELWIKSETSNSSTQTIISKREAGDLIDGYDLSLVDNYVSFNWNNGQSLTSPYQIVTNRWHHIAVSFSGTIYKLFIDGIELNSRPGSSPTSNDSDCIIGAMDQNQTPPFKPLHYFNGGMDELRIWDIALSASQIQKMMNQEVEEDIGTVKGSVVPIEITGLMWNDLNGYYQMNQITDISNGSLISSNSNTIDGVLRYMTTLQSESAPLPYQTNADGLWSSTTTWLNGTIQAIPNSLGIDGITPLDWNIVRTSHNIHSGNLDITLLGLDVTANTLFIENTNPQDGQSMTITEYLKLNGTLDLVGESQLLQKTNSVVDYTGLGKLERDQQGTSNLYNYNYWSSPVSLDGSTFTVGSVLKDGSTDTNPEPIVWTSSNNASGNVPINLSNRWIYTYEDTAGADYFDWVYKGETNPIDVGLGFTMKGSGVGDPVTDFQNYVFEGLPNNGDIMIPVLATYQALVGNPYPSAIDANKFIVDNGPTGTNAIDGSIYFWEHASTNDSHVLSEYEGGYATYNLSGGLPAITAPSEINGLGSANKIPQQFVPVAQGFYVTSSAAGGLVTFNNDQRIFAKESSGNSIFLRENPMISNANATPDVIQRVRLLFKSPDGSKRPLLLAFTPNNAATDGIDYGYDAENTEVFPNDASFIITDKNYTIQGTGNFNTTNRYPLGIFLSDAGVVEISLTGLENFESDIDVYVYDALNDTSTLINTQNYLITLDAGDFYDRFFITFEPTSALSNNADNPLENAIVKYLEDTDELYIHIPQGTNLQNVQLFNILGQPVRKWDKTNFWTDTKEIRFPIKNISEGTYIVKVQTTSFQSINKKIIVRY